MLSVSLLASSNIHDPQAGLFFAKSTPFKPLQDLTPTNNDTGMAQYVSVPIYDRVTDAIWTLAEYNRVLYRIYLEDDMTCPALPDFPMIPEGLRVEEVRMCPEVKKLFKCSARLDCGADAIIRVLDEDPTVVMKFAMPMPLARARLSNELALLQYMQHLPLPIPALKGHAFADEDGLIAFCMDRLYEWKPKEENDLQHTLRKILEQLHSYGICHNDLREANLMQDAASTPILIDFGHSGFIGQPIPDLLRDDDNMETPNAIFDVVADQNAISLARLG